MGGARTITFVLGAPGAGKGTQCARIVEEFGWKHLSTGDLLRAEVAAGTELGQEASALMEAGEMVPTSLVLDLLINAMDNSGATRFLVDGFPRKLDQLEEFEAKIQPADFVLAFTLPEEVAVQRLVKRGETSGRADDNEDTIRSRMQVFMAESQPVIDALKGTGRVAEIDSQEDVDAVFGLVTPVMETLQQLAAEKEAGPAEGQQEESDAPAQTEDTETAAADEAAAPDVVPVEEGELAAAEEATQPEQEAAAPAEQEEAAPTEQEEAAPAEEGEAAPTEQEEAAPAEQEEATPAEQEEAAPTEQKAAPAEEGEAAPTEQEEAATAEQEEATPAEQEAAPAEEGEAAPPEHSEAAPAEQEEAAPAEEGEAAPTEQAEAAPAEEGEAAPPVHSEAAPAEQEEAAPAEEGEAVPTEQEEAAPTEQEEADPAEQEEAAPPEVEEAAAAEQEEAPPAEEEEAAPAEQEEAAPAEEEEAAPAEQEEAAPAEEEEATPAEQEAAPAEEGEAAPPEHAVAAASVQLPEDSKIVFVLGAPGAGKGTQCARIVEEFGWKHLSTGDLLRAEVAAGTDLGRQADEVMQSGGFVSTSMICDLLVSAMASSGANRFLVDGFPRKLDQLEEFEAKIRPADFVLAFTLPEEVAVQRLVKRGETSGRADDNEDTIRSRMQVFMAESQPVIDALKGTGRVAEIDSQEEVDAVYGRVRHVIAGIEGTTLPDAAAAEQEEAAPAEQEEAAPPEVEEAAPPEVEDAAPAEEGEAAPAGEEETAPAEQEEAAPAGEEEAAPAEQEKAAPAEQEEAAPPEHAVAAASVQLPEDSKIVFVLGAPGAGKGTQCARIVEEFGWKHLSTGDLLRAEVAAGTDLGRQADEVMQSGGFVSTSMICDLLVSAMASSGANRFLVDGFPRKLDQLEEFEAKIRPADFVLAFTLPEEVAVQRLVKRGETSGRADDNEDTIRSRMQVFMAESQPVIDALKGTGRVAEIDSQEEVDAVYGRVRHVIAGIEGTTLPDAAAAEQEEAAPAEQEEAAPPEVEEAAPPEVEDAAPAEEGEAAPAGEEETAPAEQEEAAPAGEEEAAPAEQEKAAPAEQEEAAPPEHAVAAASVQLPEDSKIVFVLGAPGAGKGTQCARIVEEFGWKHLSTGDLLRAEVAAGTDLGRQADEVMQSGGFVSTSMICDLLVSAMASSGANRFLVDGFPRKLDQLEEFEAKIRPADFVLAFTLPEEVAVQRLVKRGETSGRADDNEDTIRSRMQVFMAESQPVIDALKGTGRVAEIDSQEEVDAVYGRVRHVIAGIEGTTLPDAAAAEQEEAAPAEQEEAAPPEVEEAAPPEVEDAAPAEEGEAAPAGEEETAPAEQEEAAPAGEEEAAPAEQEKAAPAEQEEAAPPEHAVAAASVQLPEDSKIVFVLGAPGAGKGTQCARIVEEFGWKHLSTGDLLRAEVAAGTDLGRQADEVMQSGGFVSTSMICDLLVSAMASSGANRFLVDGFPRKLDQLEEFEAKIRPADFVLAFTLPEEVAVQRLVKRGETSGRADDNEDTIRSRMQVFMAESQPVIDALKGTGRVAEIDSQEEVDAVYGRVRHVIAGIEGTTLPDAAAAEQEEAAPAEQEEAAPPEVEEAAPPEVEDAAPAEEGEAAPAGEEEAAPTEHDPAAAQESAEQLARLAESVTTLLVVSGPSGVGKGTLIQKLMAEHGDKFGFTTSNTTRAARPGEQDGVHYHYVGLEAMQASVAHGAFLEHAGVHGNMYGTSLRSVAEVCAAGKIPVLDIDVQGAAQVRNSVVGDRTVSIFIAPPSLDELEARLRGRATETEDRVLARLSNAAREIDESSSYTSVVVNGLFDQAYADLKQAIQSALPGTFPPEQLQQDSSSAAPAEVQEEQQQQAPASKPGSRTTSRVASRIEASRPTSRGSVAALAPPPESPGRLSQRQSSQASHAAPLATKPPTPPAAPPPGALPPPRSPLAASRAAAASAPHGGQSMNSNKPGGLPVRQYMDTTVVPILREALRALNDARPPDPLQFLADQLLAARAKLANHH